MSTEYVVWRPDWEQSKEDGRHIKARCPSEACEAWAQREDCESADYHIVGGSDAFLKVAEARDGAKELAYVVSGETVAEYRARLVQSAPASFCRSVTGQMRTSI